MRWLLTAALLALATLSTSTSTTAPTDDAAATLLSSSTSSPQQRRLAEVLASQDKFFYIYEWPSYLVRICLPTVGVVCAFSHHMSTVVVGRCVAARQRLPQRQVGL